MCMHPGSPRKLYGDYHIEAEIISAEESMVLGYALLAEARSQPSSATAQRLPPIPLPKKTPKAHPYKTEKSLLPKVDFLLGLRQRAGRVVREQDRPPVFRERQFAQRERVHARNHRRQYVVVRGRLGRVAAIHTVVCNLAHAHATWHFGVLAESAPHCAVHPRPIYTIRNLYLLDHWIASREGLHVPRGFLLLTGKIELGTDKPRRELEVANAWWEHNLAQHRVQRLECNSINIVLSRENRQRTITDGDDLSDWDRGMSLGVLSWDWIMMLSRHLNDAKMSSKPGVIWTTVTLTHRKLSLAGVPESSASVSTRLSGLHSAGGSSKPHSVACSSV